jgi:hypothetical protein
VFWRQANHQRRGWGTGVKEIIFQLDEIEFRHVDPEWDRETLLAQDGIFYLKDLIEPLNLSRVRLYKAAETLHASGQDPWMVMGLRTVWTFWLIRMKTFSKYYGPHVRRPFKKVPETWNANDLANQTEGVYLLTEVCKLIPFTVHQIHFQAKKHPQARQKLGVWRDETLGVYLVNLVAFSPWLRTTWLGKPKEEPK